MYELTVPFVPSIAFLNYSFFIVPTVLSVAVLSVAAVPTVLNVPVTILFPCSVLNIPTVSPDVPRNSIGTEE